MDYSSARSKSLFLIHYRLLILQVILRLILFPSTMADPSDCGASTNDPFQNLFAMSDNSATSADHPDHEENGNKLDPVLAQKFCYCSSEQLKENLGPVIRRRLRDLLNKALTVEYVTEAAHTIDLLKILHGSNSKLDRIRDEMHKAAQTLKSALAEIPDDV